MNMVAIGRRHANKSDGDHFVQAKYHVTQKMYYITMVCAHIFMCQLKYFILLRRQLHSLLSVQGRKLMVGMALIYKFQMDRECS